MSPQGGPETRPVRPGEELPLGALGELLRPAVESGALKGDPGQLSAEQFPGGFSNLTYLLRLGDGLGGEGEYVLRRAPLGPVAKGAHDMVREYHLLARLSPHLPAAPRPLLLVEDPALLGSPFYLMERRRGVIVRRGLPPEYAAQPGAAAALSEALMDTLADLHAVDIQGAGLSDLGKPQGFNRRQVEGWAGRWRRARQLLAGLPGDPFPYPDLGDEEVIAWLEARLPAESDHTLVHNDFKLDNLMFDPADPRRVTALLDWEMAALGDPLADLGLTLTYWQAPGFGNEGPGFLSREALLARYAERSGRDVSGVGWYEVLGHFKLACIALQIYARYAAGQTRDPRFADLGERAASQITGAQRLVAGL